MKTAQFQFALPQQIFERGEWIESTDSQMNFSTVKDNCSIEQYRWERRGKERKSAVEGRVICCCWFRPKWDADNMHSIPTTNPQRKFFIPYTNMKHKSWDHLNPNLSSGEEINPVFKVTQAPSCRFSRKIKIYLYTYSLYLRWVGFIACFCQHFGGMVAINSVVKLPGKVTRLTVSEIALEQ